MVHCCLPHRRRRRIGLGHLQPCAGSERRRWRRERRLPPRVVGGGAETEAGELSGRRFRQAERRGLDEDRAPLC